jgi:hypothetical protein
MYLPVRESGAGPDLTGRSGIGRFVNVSASFSVDELPGFWRQCNCVVSNGMQGEIDIA